MRLPPLRTIPLILRPQAWLHRRHYGEVLSPIRWWGRIPLVFYLVSMFVGYLERKRSPLDPVLRALVQRPHRSDVSVRILRGYHQHEAG
ncbi:carboxymuconolactone decarboxylase family protein [Raoultella ornithinolytica]|nr:carboxymuconolactone decarboxylase family protein [Raoultella ornithinolytica]